MYSPMLQRRKMIQPPAAAATTAASSLSTFLTSGGNDVRSCPICLEDECTDTVSNADCGHSVCRDCLYSQCEYNVSIKKLPILCPFGCQARLSLETIKDVLLVQGQLQASSSSSSSIISKKSSYGIGIWETYCRLTHLSQDNSSACECPWCDGIILPARTVGAATSGGQHEQESANMSNGFTCQECGLDFCRIHGMAHDSSMTCAKYLLTPQGRALEESERMLEQLTKPCPMCDIRIEKIGGCAHMVCIGCDTTFCWDCGTDVNMVGVGGFLQCSCALTGLRRDDEHFFCYNLAGLSVLLLLFYLHGESMGLAWRVGLSEYLFLCADGCTPSAYPRVRYLLQACFSLARWLFFVLLVRLIICSACPAATTFDLWTPPH